MLLFLLVALPLIDRSPDQSPEKRKWILTLTAVVLLAVVVLGTYGSLSGPSAHVGG